MDAIQIYMRFRRSKEVEVMTSHVAAPVLIAFVISAVLGPVIIPFLRKLKVGQTEREELKSHLKKTGTPTMGGLIILAGTLGTSLLFVKDYPKIIPILFLTVGFGVIGFLDDYLKVVLRRSVIGTVNGVNFTDGLDGLASSVTVLVATFFTVVAVGTKSGIEPITCAVAGALLGFLLFNVYPAKVFMGDTGSLALGGFVAATAYMLQMPLFIPIVGFIYMIEVISVMLQVSYFKATHGKRIFRMAPIHHHFELGGWSETRVVAVFSVVTALLALVALMAL